MGKLICVCDRASLEECDKCLKAIMIKPDKTFNHPSWPWRPISKKFGNKNKAG